MNSCHFCEVLFDYMVMSGYIRNETAMSVADPEICLRGDPMTRKTCGAVRWSSFFLTSFNRDRGGPGPPGPPWICYCMWLHVY